MTVMARTSKKTQLVEEPHKIPPAYFTVLEVENVLCFKDKQVLDLSDKNGNPAQWTVILGDNGVGKTTLLRCIAGMEMCPAGIFPSEEGKEITNYFPIFFQLQNQKIVLPWTDYQRTKYGWEITSVAVYGVQLSYFKNYPNKNNRNKKIKVRYKPGYLYITPPDGHLDLANLSGLICYGYGATRKVGKATLSDASLNEGYYKETSASLFLENPLLLNAEEWLLQTDYSSKYSKDNKQINNIKEILKRVLPDVEDIEISLEDIPNPRPQVKFKMSYGDWIPFTDMGLGYKTMITWILDLVIRLYKRYPESDDPLSEPAIVLVDEIDLHLHPKWQRTIMDFLTERFPNTQFIVTAHSPLVVQAAQDANIVLLRREGDRVVIDNNPEIIDNWRVDQILTSLFELPSARSATLDPLLKRREEILTKSKLTPKDKAELKAIAEQIGHLPTGETPEDIQAMDIIRRAAKLLEQKEKS